MRNTNEDFTVTERLIVVAILVIVALVAAENLLQSVQQTEERTLNSAVGEYVAVRSMYAEGPTTVPPPTIQVAAMGTEADRSAPSK